MARLFTVATDDTLIDMIWTATQRLVIVAPGISQTVAKNLVARIEVDGGPPDLSVTLDTDPEICRLGYGEIEALELLRPALESLQRVLQTQSGVRIGLVVADADVLVYSPTPQLIEAGSTSEEKPNAIRITGAGPEELALACGAAETSVLGHTQEVGLHSVTEEVVQKTKANLDINPPKKFDLARLERVFNYKLEFVEFSVEGMKLNAKAVPLPAEILGLDSEDLQERLRNSFRVFDSGVPFRFDVDDRVGSQQKIHLTEGYFAKEAQKLRRAFIPMGTYGNLIQKHQKPFLEAGVGRLRSLLAVYTKSVKEQIGPRIDATRDSLINSLYPRLKANPPEVWSNHFAYGVIPDDVLRSRLEAAIDLAFRKVAESFSPEITCTFKGVRYDTITADPVFRKGVEKHFGAEETAKLFAEYDASRAEDRKPA